VKFLFNYVGVLNAQIKHCDFVSPLPDEPMPYSMVIALQDGSSLIVHDFAMSQDPSIDWVCEGGIDAIQLPVVNQLPVVRHQLRIQYPS
jgi:hypothetical protein